MPANPHAFVTSVGKSLDRPTLKALFPDVTLGTPGQPIDTEAQAPVRKSLYLLKLRKPQAHSSHARLLDTDSIATLVKQSIARKRGDLYI